MNQKENEITIEDFLNEEYSQSALYASFRSIASYVDGLKPSSRKVVYALKKMNLRTDTKVSRLAATVAQETEYLHGEVSLQNVIVNLAQDFTGSNNDNLLHPSGNFGTRFIPAPSAARYIFTRKSDSFDSYFSSLDDPILISQEFEGSIIEPKFFVPTLPLLFINGSEGIGTGFAQKILPRKKETLKKYILSKLNSTVFKDPLFPFYKGFKGTIQKEDDSWVFQGKFEKKNSTTIEITELPINYTLASYVSVLNDLVDKKVIKNYEDLSEDDTFFFRIDARREFVAQTDEKLFQILKLEKRVSENFTCVNENNSITEFTSVEDILNAYIDLRLDYYQKRKDYLIGLYQKELDILDSKIIFIQSIVDGKLIVSNRKKDDIEKDLKSIEGIIQVDESFDYLLRMAIWSLTKEKIDDLKKQYQEKKNMFQDLKKKTNKDLWVDDLENV